MDIKLSKEELYVKNCIWNDKNRKEKRQLQLIDNIWSIISMMNNYYKRMTEDRVIWNNLRSAIK